MSTLAALWVVIILGAPEFNIPHACGESGSPTEGPAAHLFTFETVDADQAIIARSKSNGTIGGVYFMTMAQCNKHLAKYAAIWEKDSYGD